MSILSPLSHLFSSNEPPIRQQVSNFIEYKKRTKNLSVAVSHKEWVMKFVGVCKLNDVHDATWEDVLTFKEWLLNRYAGDYSVQSALGSVRCFLYFYKKHQVVKCAKLRTKIEF